MRKVQITTSRYHFAQIKILKHTKCWLKIKKEREESGIRKHSSSGFGVKIGKTPAEDEVVISSEVRYMHSLMTQRCYLPVNCVQ